MGCASKFLHPTNRKDTGAISAFIELPSISEKVIHAVSMWIWVDNEQFGNGQWHYLLDARSKCENGYDQDCPNPAYHGDGLGNGAYIASLKWRHKHPSPRLAKQTGWKRAIIHDMKDVASGGQPIEHIWTTTKKANGDYVGFKDKILAPARWQHMYFEAQEPFKHEYGMKILGRFFDCPVCTRLEGRHSMYFRNAALHKAQHVPFQFALLSVLHALLKPP